MKTPLRSFVLMVVGLLATGLVFAQNTFPDRPVKIIISFSAGTGVDAVARQVADKLTSKWRQPVVVDNRPGGAGVIAVQALKQAPADGYTLIMADGGLVTITPNVFKKPPYDSVADFAGIALLYRAYYVMATSVKGPFTDFRSLVALAREKPGQVAYASSGVGSVSHLGGAMLADAVGAQMRHIPYKDASQMYTDLSNGDPAWIWGTTGTMQPFLDSKKLRLVAAASPHRLKGHEDLPTISEVGGPKDLAVDTWIGLFSRRGTPENVLNQISRDVSEAMRSPEVRARLAAVQYELAEGSPKEVDELVVKDLRKFEGLVKAAKIELQ